MPPREKQSPRTSPEGPSWGRTPPGASQDLGMEIRSTPCRHLSSLGVALVRLPLCRRDSWAPASPALGTSCCQRGPDTADTACTPDLSTCHPARGVSGSTPRSLHMQRAAGRAWAAWSSANDHRCGCVCGGTRHRARRGQATVSVPAEGYFDGHLDRDSSWPICRYALCGIREDASQTHVTEKQTIPSYKIHFVRLRWFAVNRLRRALNAIQH